MPASTPIARDSLERTEPALERTSRGARPAAETSLWRRIRRDVVLLAFGNIAIVLAQLAFRGILLKALAPPDYGRLSLILSIYNTVWILGASGLPNAAARHIALISPADDSEVIRSALRAGAMSITIAAGLVAVAAGILLRSPLSGALGAVGVISLVYSLLSAGILRGRGHVASAAAVMPTASVFALIALAALGGFGLAVTPLLGFGCFCLGNMLGLATGFLLVRRTRPRFASRAASAPDGSVVPTPSARELLSLSVWLGAATAGVAVLPLVVRSAAALDSYTVAAIVDIAIVLFAIPQRMGTVIVSAVVPHATRAAAREGLSLRISRRENLLIALPFALVAALVAFTPLMHEAFLALGRPVYSQSSKYLALALLASPPRILYGVVEGVLVAHGEGRFLATAAWAITLLASGGILALAALGDTVGAFAVFVAAFWAIYLVGHVRIGRLRTVEERALA